MTLSQHPSDETLGAFAAGTLDEGSAFVTGVHIAMCLSCREAVRMFECIGGALILDSHEIPLLSEAAFPAGQSAETGTLELPVKRAQGAPHEQVLGLYKQGPWKWQGFGIQSADVDLPAEGGVRVFLLKAAAGSRMPLHTHTGTELTLVLKGSFSHELGYFGPGDFEEADDVINHRPSVGKQSECICLVAMSGRLKLQGLAGRILQPFVRI